MTNTNLQHLLGEVYLSYGSQIFFINGTQVTTFEADAMSATDDGQAKPQVIAWGPVAAQTPLRISEPTRRIPLRPPTPGATFLSV